RDYLAEFVAKGGQVKRAPEGIAYGVNKDADKVKRAIARQFRSENSLIEERHVGAMDHCGRSVITNGLGEIIAYE
ncbi:MAG: hypothetical protein RB191_02110, partial [Terriglobia bacterium]|nr:hypothetical protein [Terriglobia bacterium]